MNNNVTIGEVIPQYNSAYTKVLRYMCEIKHHKLKEHKIVTAQDVDFLKNKVQTIIDKWEEKWDIISTRTQNQNNRQASIEEAIKLTKEAEEKLVEISNILNHTLGVDDTVNWDQIKINKKFTKQDPLNNLSVELSKIKTPTSPILNTIPPPPDKNAKYYQPDFDIIAHILPFYKKKLIEQSNSLYQSDFKSWSNRVEELKNENAYLTSKYETELAFLKSKTEQIHSDIKSAHDRWVIERDSYNSNQIKHNEKIETLKSQYELYDSNAIVEYNELVLNNSVYPDFIEKSFELYYNSENKIIICEYELPTIDKIPNVKEVKYLTTKNELKYAFLNQKELEKIYDDCIYQIVLRTVHEIFEADYINAIEQIAINGWVNSLNSATGKVEHICIVTLTVSKDEFLKINLSMVEPKVCFKSLKGIGSTILFSMTPVRPIMQINRNDSRIVDSHDVLFQVDDSFNLATMDWEDFEHLIREVFQREFNTEGAEVKVTQASRDGGVDAIVFDPDPIKGGKIVIQAKRYNNLVPVSAVRDLYGTVVNEGATKGILVTTSDFGPDSYNFAKDKPISLLNGNNLLYLLEKQGTKARINLKEIQ